MSRIEKWLDRIDAGDFDLRAKYKSAQGTTILQRAADSPLAKYQTHNRYTKHEPEDSSTKCESGSLSERYDLECFRIKHEREEADMMDLD